MDDITRKCRLCQKVKPLKSFDRNSELCTSCYNFIKKAQRMGIFKLTVSRQVA